MNERTPTHLLGSACMGALGALALVYVGWNAVDNWMRRAGRVA
jgi:hypothetical protein